MASIGSGKAPPREIVRLARHLHAKHPEDPAYEWWSSLGGASLTNVERDLHRRSKPWTSKALEPFVIPLTLESDHDGAYTAQWATLAPYEVFHAIYEAGPQFEVSFLGADGPPGVADYWASYSESMTHHVASEHWDERGSFIPIFLHTDGGECFNDEEFSIWQWSSALAASGNTWDYRIFCTLLPEHRKHGRVTDDELVAYFAWNISVLESKKHPACDHLGRPLQGNRANRAGLPIAGPWGAAFVGHLCDLKERVKVKKFQRNFQCNFLCEKCLGCRHLVEGNAYDMAEGALWTKLLVTHEGYLASTSPSDLSPFVRFRSWTIQRNRDDLLHCCWLGFAKDVSGQLMFDVATMYMGGDLNSTLPLLHDLMVKWFRNKGVWCGMRAWRQTTLSWQDWNDYPVVETKMKGIHSKMTFLFMAWLVVMIVKEGVDTTPYARKRATMAWCLHEAIRLFDGSDRWMPRPSADRSSHFGWSFLRCYQQLAAEAVACNRCAFKLRPKFHGFAHLLMEVQLTRENPKGRDLFDCEDYVGKVKALASQCHRGNIDEGVCRRMILFLTHRWQSRRKVA